ncbi:MAG: bactofilin family protein [Elusimicrobiota bacterium]
MVAKNAKESDARMETVIGPQSHVQGTLETKGSVRVDGRLEGDVTAETLIVGETGDVRGDVTADHAVVGGKITGNVTAAGTLELQARCHVYGDIRTAHLTIADGAVFEGTCHMTADKAVGMDNALHAAS